MLRINRVKQFLRLSNFSSDAVLEPLLFFSKKETDLLHSIAFTFKTLHFEKNQNCFQENYYK